MFERVPNRRMYEDIIQQILTKIDENAIVVGDRLPPEREFAEIVGVSRGTLREAFRVLEQQGIIETKSGRGRFIAKLPKQHDDTEAMLERLEHVAMFDLLEARETLEQRIAELACERATAQDLLNIREVLGLLEADNQTETSSPVDLDHAFHLAIAEAAHNNVFASYIQLSLELLSRIRRKTLSSPERVAEFKSEHTLIVEALEKRDKNMARTAVCKHLANISRRIEEMDPGTMV